MPLSENHFGSSSLEKYGILNAVSNAPVSYAPVSMKHRLEPHKLFAKISK